MAKLVLFDDGSVEGETFRIRKDKTIIGRSGSDIEILHDQRVADQHILVERELRNDQFRWVLRDLNSQTGFWVRVRKIELREGSEFVAGSGRYCFQDAKSMDGEQRQAILDRIENGSFPGSESILGESYAKLTKVETLRQSDVGNSMMTFQPQSSHALSLIEGEYWIGRDPNCAMASREDPFLAAQHVCVSLIEKKWVARTEGVPNGMWMRMDQIVVNHSCTFQIGEQRCRLITTWTRDEL